jgi:hypothetical protein
MNLFTLLRPPTMPDRELPVRPGRNRGRALAGVRGPTGGVASFYDSTTISRDCSVLIGRPRPITPSERACRYA